MSADWYFVKTGFFGGHKTVGPMTEPDFCKKIEKGEINPDTMVSSTSKTHGRWLKMGDIRVARKHWEKTHPSAGAA